ncbi:hypothetical protein OH77DRAFT_1431490, partial [Trametes cingulata]
TVYSAPRSVAGSPRYGLGKRPVVEGSSLPGGAPWSCSATKAVHLDSSSQTLQYRQRTKRIRPQMTEIQLVPLPRQGGRQRSRTSTDRCASGLIRKRYAAAFKRAHSRPDPTRNEREAHLFVWLLGHIWRIPVAISTGLRTTVLGTIVRLDDANS